MNIDIRLAVGWNRHPKIVKLKRKLGADGVMALVSLWTFCGENRTNGVLSGMDDDDIAIAADYPGDTKELIGALESLRLIERNGNDWAMHDWEDHQGYAIHAEARAEKARRAAEARWGSKKDAPSIKKDAPSIKKDAPSNAPNPNPNPNPNPDPDPIQKNTLVVVEADAELSARDGPPPPPPPGIARTPKTENAAFETIRSLWDEICVSAGLDGLRDVRGWPKKRRDAAWRLWAVEAKGDPDKIRKLFEYVVSCPRLIGGTKPRPGYNEPWRADFDWLLREDDFSRLLEGRFAPRVAAHA